MPLHKEGYENVGVVRALTGERVQGLYVFQTHRGGISRQVDRWNQEEISTSDSTTADRILVDAGRQPAHHRQGQDSARAETTDFGVREKIVIPTVGSGFRDNNVEPALEDSLSTGEELVWLGTNEVWETWD
jgi:hypothetical protein